MSSIFSRSKAAFTKASTYAQAHKLVSAAALVFLLGGGWWAYAHATSASAQTKYVLGTVEKGTIVSTVSGSGQVSATDSIDIKPKASGDITRVLVSAGQTVGEGQALAYIDSTDAVQALNSAKKSLEADQLQYQKSAAQAPVDYQNDLRSLDAAKTSLTESYNDTFNDVTSMYLDFPDVMAAAQNTLYGYDFDSTKGQWNMNVLFDLVNNNGRDVTTAQDFQNTSKENYASANAQYIKTLGVYKQSTRNSSQDSIDSLLQQSTDVASGVAQALQSELNFLGTISDMAQTYNATLPSKFTTVQSAARTALATANSDLSKLIADKKALDNAKQAVITAQQNVTLDQVGNPDGSNPISLQISKNSLEKSEQDIADQEAALGDYTIRAPFAGTLASVSMKRGDAAGSAAVATLITDSKIAQLSLNEVDAAKVKVGEKATLTFDAIDGLTLTGKVAEVDSIGAVSQGVVSYSVKISFDSQDERVKPGMTVNASIQTDVAQDVLVVPSSAVKTQNGASYVQMFEPALEETGGTQGVASKIPPTQVEVQTGISDDTNVQIVSGLTEGEQIVTRTSSGTAAASSAAARTGAANRAGGFGGGAGAIRF
jgi:HlyD family secretion protein